MPHKDFALLLAQPASIEGLARDERDRIIISALHDGRKTVVLSVYADPFWDLWPFIPNADRTQSDKQILWRSVPARFVEQAKAVAYTYWMKGRRGKPRPKALTVIKFVQEVRLFLVWLEKRGVARLADVRVLHTLAFVKEFKARRGPSGMSSLISAIECLYELGTIHKDRIGHPWPDVGSRWKLGGGSPQRKRAGATPIIPEDDIVKMFAAAERLLERAAVILAGDGEQSEEELLPVACFFILGLITGCRLHELLALEVHAVRMEVRDEVTFHWLRGESHKTHAGRLEWLMPEIGVRCVEVLEQWSAPLRDLAERVGRSRRDPKRVAAARRLARRLFLVQRQRGSTDVENWRGSDLRTSLRDFATFSGSDWLLAPHQLRRTFAVSVAHHMLGDLRYLRHHFRHWSMDMTALYAANAAQDEDLFDEVLFAMRDQKVAIIENWLDEGFSIAGGAAAPIKAFRADHKINVIRSRRSLAEDTASKTAIRATGHGWCLASDDGCGGQGLYEATRCIDCKNGLIDERHAPVWTALHAQQLELLRTAADCGPGGRQRLQRDLARSERLLADLGIPVPEGET